MFTDDRILVSADINVFPHKNIIQWFSEYVKLIKWWLEHDIAIILSHVVDLHLLSPVVN